MIMCRRLEIGHCMASRLRLFFISSVKHAQTCVIDLGWLDLLGMMDAMPYDFHHFPSSVSPGLSWFSGKVRLLFTCNGPLCRHLLMSASHGDTLDRLECDYVVPAWGSHYNIQYPTSIINDHDGPERLHIPIIQVPMISCDHPTYPSSSFRNRVAHA